MIVLGLESSCDETSAAILIDGKIASNLIYTQSIHSQFGGVVPEIASRAHIQKIDRLTTLALEENNLTPADLDLIAVTDRPGLAGALLVGISFALGLHAAWNTPIIGVNHLEGHIASAILEHEDHLEFPFLALVVSGGHTAIWRVNDFGDYHCIGSTIDDAAGEAFDKVGKMLGFEYPAGKAIEEASVHASVKNQKLIPLPVARLSTPGIDFSFSGLKTAVRNLIAKENPSTLNERIPLICASFQDAVVRSLVSNMKTAIDKTGITRIAVVGGVACNTAIRAAFLQTFKSVYFPSPILCTDNAAMIAKCGEQNYIRGHRRFPTMSPSGTLSVIEV